MSKISKLYVILCPEKIPIFMKSEIEKRKPEGPLDYLSLSVTTFGVGYLPIAPGTWGSMVGVLIYLGIDWWLEMMRSGPELSFFSGPAQSQVFALLAVCLTVFALLALWASGRAVSLLGNSDPSQAVVDEVLGQLITLTFVPFGIGWPFVLAGFLLFRFFDIWKPYPIRQLEVLPGGLGICADDIVAGVYAGICLSVIYTVSLSI